MASRTCILLVFGIPATGKSSLVKELLSRTDQWRNDVQCLHVCTDDFYPPDLREQEKSDRSTLEQFKWKECRRSINTCIEKCLSINSDISDSTSAGKTDKWEEFIKKMCVRNNTCCLTRINDSGKFLSDFTVIIVDDNLPLRSMRYEYFQIAKKTSSGFCEVFITCELDKALLWNSERSRQIPSNTIVTMATSIEPPEPMKYHWEEKSAIMESDHWWDHGDRWKEICGQVYQLCESALKNSEKPVDLEDLLMKEGSRQITRENLVHQVDQKLRECVSLVMQKYKTVSTGRNIKEEANLANGIRKSVLDEFRSGKFSFQEKDSESALIQTIEERFAALYSHHYS